MRRADGVDALQHAAQGLLCTSSTHQHDDLALASKLSVTELCARQQLKQNTSAFSNQHHAQQLGVTAHTHRCFS
jgi:alcohol dehydrogenase class IV